MNRSAFQYLAFLTLFALSGEALAAPVVIRDDGPNGPLGSCVLPEGHWEITFTKTYAVKLSANGSGTSSADVLYGDLLVDITCDGTVKILEIEPTTARESHFEYVYPRQPDAPYGFPYPPTSASTDIVPVTYREVRALRDGQGGNPLIELDVVLGEKSLHWRWQVTEVSERTGHSLIGRAPWTQDSLAASRPDAPIDPTVAEKGQYRRLSDQELYAISRGDPFPPTPDGHSGYPSPAGRPAVAEGALDEFWLVPAGRRVPLALSITTPEGGRPTAGQLPARDHYLAIVDWNQRGPGEISYYLFKPSTGEGSRRGIGRPTNTGFEIPVDIDGLAPGEYEVLFTARAGDGVSVERESLLIVVPVSGQ